MHHASMRTTINLRDDLHDRLASLARDRNQTLSQTVDELLRRAMDGEASCYELVRDPATGLLGIRFGTTITAEDIRSLDDPE